MSMLSHEQIDSSELPSDVRGEIVEQTIDTLKRVAVNNSTVEYEVLPAQSDAFEITDLVTDGMRRVEDRGSFYSGFHISRASFHDVPLEFVAEYSRMESEDEQEIITAWGVRKLAETAVNESPSKKMRLPSSIFHKTLQDIDKLQEPERKQLPRAA